MSIYHDDQFRGMVDKLSDVMKMRAMKFKLTTGSYREQFELALSMEGQTTETGETLPPSGFL